MAYRIEEKTIIIDGWEKGIGDSPHTGIANMKNVDISVPGEVSVMRKTTALTKPPTVTALAYTAEMDDDKITVASTNGWFNGMAISFDSVSGSPGFSTGRVYWVGSLTGTTFKIYKSPKRNNAEEINITADSNGNLSSYTLGKPIEQVWGNYPTGSYNYHFILDANGRAWMIDNYGSSITNNLIYLGNDTLTGAQGRGIAVFKQHLIVFRGAAMDGLLLNAIEAALSDLDSAYDGSATGGWSYGWDTVSTLDGTLRDVSVGDDDILYFDNNGTRIGSVSENTGTTFVLNNSATWTKDSAALDIPELNDGSAIQISELGSSLILGSNANKLYPWDRISSSFNIPILMPEHKTQKMVSSNNLLYIFAGFRGNIYLTNGSSIELFKKIPDYITGELMTYFTIKDVIFHRNQLLFSFTAFGNGGSTITGIDGVWAIDLLTGSLRLLNTLSHGTAGTVHTISFYSLTDTPNGFGFIAGWEDASGNYGVDIGSSNPYSAGETIIDSDIIPIGTYVLKRTPTSIEFKLSKPLVSGESVELQYRSNLNESFTSISSTNTVGAISDMYNINFENVQWIQIRSILTSTDTTPSFVPLKEVRINL